MLDAIQGFVSWTPLGLPAFLFVITIVVFFHELGHFLLRSTAHTPRGLMRAAYGTPELMDDSVQPYALTRTQVAEIRRTTSALSARREP
jgi:hypothetical protein